jgi:hypothetical protein
LLGDVTGGDVVDVEEHFVLALAGPDLVAGVAGVLEDRPNRTLTPGAPAARPVAVAGGVGGAGGGMPSWVRAVAMGLMPWPARKSAKIRCTTGA